MNADLRTIWGGIYQYLGNFESEELQLIKSAVISELGKYDISVKETNTEITVYEDENIGYQMFFMSKKVEGLSMRTLKYYKDTVDKFVERVKKPIKAITTDDIRFYLAVRQTQDKVSIVTSENERRNLNSFFAWLTEEGYIQKNPCKPIKKAKTRKVKKKAFSEVELVKIKDACKVIDGKLYQERRLRDIALVEFLISTACRVGEVTELKREDINLETRTALVVGKGNKERTVYISNTAKLRLTEYWNCIDEKPYAFSALGNSGKLEGGKMSIAGIELEVRALGKIANVSDCHPHRFRRTCATMALKKGMTIVEVQRMLGHENLDTTKIYLDLDDTDLKYQHDKYF